MNIGEIFAILLAILFIGIPALFLLYLIVVEFPSIFLSKSGGRKKRLHV